MAVRTKELGTARNPGANVIATLYTCPAGKTAIVKELAGQVQANSTVAVFVQRGLLTYTLFSLTVTATTPILNSRWTVLEPGDILKCFFTTASSGQQLWVSGSELDGVA